MKDKHNRDVEALKDELAEEMRKDILQGIGETDVKAGLIGEIGTSAIMSDSEKKVLKAAGMVGAETGKAIHVHTDLYTENGFEVIDILTREGARPEKICIDHVDVWLRPDYIRRLLDMGLTPRTRVMVRKIAPMGDPIELNLRGYELTIRLEDARKIAITEEEA